MHVPEFFCNFSIRIYVEVIIAPLPKAPTRCLPEFTLGGGPPLKQQPAGNALLQDLHHDRNRTSLWLADQDVNVLGHDHESDYLEAIALAHLLEDFEKYITGTGTSQERLALIAARGDEV